MNHAPVSRETGPLSIVVTASIWANRSFLVLVSSYIVASVGSKVYGLALPLILYDATQSAIPMSTMRAIEFLPNLLFAMFIGVFVDRYRKKTWTQWMLFAQSGLLLTLFTLSQIGRVPVYTYYLFGFFLMTLDYGYQNARMTMVKHAVPNALMTEAMSKFSLVSTLISLLGPAISGGLLMLSSPEYGLIVTCVLFGISAIVSMLHRDNEVVSPAKSSFWTEFVVGWRAFSNNRPLVVISVLVVFLNCSAGMMDAIMVFFAKGVLGLSNGVLGLALSAAGVGGLIGSTVVSYARRHLQLGRLIGLTVILLSASYLLMFAAHNALMMAIALFIEGVFATVQNVCIWTFRQETTPPHLIGRISGITGSIFKLGMPFAMLSTGFISQWYGTASVFLCAGALNIALFLILVAKPVRRLV